MASTERNTRRVPFIIWKIVAGLLATAIFLTIWQVVASLAQGISLLDIADSFARLVVYGDAENITLQQHAAMSMLRVTLGFGVASATAIPIGIMVGRYRAANMVLGPVIDAMRPVPPIAWIPLSILLFRTNLVGAQVFIIWLGAFFPVLINTTAGAKRTSVVHLEVAQTFGATEGQILSKIILPSSAPEIMAGLRIGFGIGWMCLVAAEMIPNYGVSLGLGYLIMAADSLGKTSWMISAMLVIGFIGFGVSYLLLRLEKSLLKWRREIAI